MENRESVVDLSDGDVVFVGCACKKVFSNLIQVKCHGSYHGDCVASTLFCIQRIGSGGDGNRVCNHVVDLRCCGLGANAGEPH